MITYLIFGCLLALFSIISNNTGKKLILPLYVYLIVLSIYLIGARDNIGVDWASYRFFYENGYAHDTVDGSQEIGYSILRDIFYNLNFSSGLYFAMMAFLSLYLILMSANKLGIQNPWLVFFIYYSLYLASFQFNIIRTGLLASFFLSSLVYKALDKRKISVILLLTGVSMHYLGMIFIPIWYILDYKFTKKQILLGFTISFILYGTGIVSFINNYLPFLLLLDGRVGDYLADSDSYGLTIGFVFDILLYLTLYFTYEIDYTNNKGFRIMLNTLFIGVLISLSLMDLAIFTARIGQVTNLSKIILIPFLAMKIKNIHRGRSLRAFYNSIFWLFIIVYCYLFFLRSISYGGKTEESKYYYPYRNNLEYLIN